MAAPKKADNGNKTPSEENAQLRGDLLTIGRRVSHDLRTPLGSISISIELLKELLNGNDAAAEVIQSLNISLDEISHLIKSLSIVARATSTPPAMEKVAMGDVVRGVSQQLERKILEKGASVNMPDVWPEVSGNPGWMEFIWWNFLANSLRHGGPAIELGWSKKKDSFHFWIRDNGKGVSPETRELLFQPFDSLHRPDSTRGLGLSIVRRLVELQGGGCGYQADAEGPQFFFTLPETKE
ncbi:MAG TPA: HAMP domain-containing sensor histidine kinase [Verrucomicrobiae bacterium]|jgi:signal transduction histidine kinase